MYSETLSSNPRLERLFTRRYLRELTARLPYRMSFLGRRQKTLDQQRLRLLQLVVALDACPDIRPMEETELLAA